MDLHEAEVLAYALMHEFGLSTWRFQFDQAKRRFGLCSYRRKLISLSAPLTVLNSKEQVEDTIRHEIAHAIAGYHAGHGDTWRATAIACGAKPERCYNKEVVRPPKEWVGTCPGCKRTIAANRRGRRSCANCSPVWDRRFIFQWERAANVENLEPK